MLNNYRLVEGVWIKQDIDLLLTQIDTIIFDIDGVLVNVDSSYFQTIKDTVQYYFTNIIKMPLEVDLTEKETILNFKVAGGFNDDWELCATLILFYLWKMKEYQISKTSDLKARPPFVSDFITQHLAEGGGLAQMTSWIKENSTFSKQIFALWDKKMIFQIAQEFYAGQRYCYDFYHFQPNFINSYEGNMMQESILITPQAENILKNYHIGIYTGRNQAETNYILGKMGWLKWITPGSVITSDDKIKKPSPLGLEILSRRFRSKGGLFIGDTMDDYLTVYNLNKEHQELKYLSAIIIRADSATNKEKELVYRQRGVDLLGENVNKIIHLLKGISNTI